VPFWHGGTGLSFVAFNLHLCGNFDDVCNGVGCVGCENCDVCVTASDRKTRYGPFVGFRNVFESFKSVSNGTVLIDTVKIYEGSCV